MNSNATIGLNEASNGNGNGNGNGHGRITAEALDSAVAAATNGILPGAVKADEAPKPVLFKVGWNYTTFLTKNGYAPSEARSEQHLALSREASAKQVSLMAELNGAGMRTKVARKAVFNKKDNRFDTALTARVVQPGCQDADLIYDLVQKAQARAAKNLSDLRQAAIRAGMKIAENT